MTDCAGRTVFALTILRALKDEMLIARVKGVATREEAARLTGAELFARRSQLPPPSDDEFYYDDLVGLAAVTPEGDKLGEIVALRNFGAGDILEIAPSPGAETLLLPFSKSVAVAIDFDAGRMIVAPPNEVEGEERGGAE